MKKLRRIFLSERNNRLIAINTWQIAAFRAIRVGPTIELERKILRKRISSIPKLTEKAISNMVRIPIRTTIIENSLDNNLVNAREN
jgi:hypothetical protein